MPLKAVIVPAKLLFQLLARDVNSPYIPIQYHLGDVNMPLLQSHCLIKHSSLFSPMPTYGFSGRGSVLFLQERQAGNIGVSPA
jgi:hypothetical protein